jgi:hypothetical protein
MEQTETLAVEFEKLRCFNCRNRMGLECAQIVGEGFLVCERCAARQERLVGPGGEVDVVGF